MTRRSPDDRLVRADRRLLGRGALLNAAAASINGGLGLLLVVIVTRGLSAGRAGVLLEAWALFGILTTLAELGADDGVLRWIPRMRAMGASAGIRGLLKVALGPVVAAGLIGAALLIGLADPLSRALVHGTGLDPESMGPILRILAAFLPLSACLTVALAATRGFETMIPSAVLGSVARPALRTAFVFASVSAGLGAGAIALTWGLPLALLLPAAAAWLAWLIRRSAGDREVAVPAASPSLASEFWRFAAPRALSSTFGITVTWLDTLLVGALLTTADAAIYAAAGRVLMVGMLALGPVQFALAPTMSRLLAGGERGRAQSAYWSATEWVVLVSWPLYVSFAVFAPFVLRLFGPAYTAGQTVLLILSLAGMVNMATGPCLTVLLMAGRSGWTLAVGAGALLVNVALNLVLIPRLGIVGAALTWGLGIALANVAGLVLVVRLLGLSPFRRASAAIAVASVVSFGGVGLVVRAAFGVDAASVAVAEIVALCAYAAFLWKNRARLPLLWARVPYPGGQPSSPTLVE